MNEYYIWLVDHIPEIENLYSLLVAELFQKEFFWYDRYEGEESRANDGRILREQYMIECDKTPHDIPQGPVTVLEMLIAFAIRIDQQTYDWGKGHTVSDIFGMFLANLGFADMTDRAIRSNDVNYIRGSLDNWMSHNIDIFGNGGLFRYKMAVAIEELDNWGQAQEWIKQQPF